MTGPAKCSVSFQSYGTEMQGNTRLAAIRKALSYSGTPRGQLLNLDSSLSHAILAAQEGSSSTTVSVVPLITPTPSASPRTVDVSVKALATLLPRDVTGLALFCPSTQKSRFLAVPSNTKSDEDVSLQAGTVCGQFVVASAYDLGSGGSSAWKVSVTTAHTPVTTSLNHLPSPPLSPVSAPLPLPEVPAQSAPAKEAAAEEVEEKTEAPLPVAIPSSLANIPFLPSTIILKILLVKLLLLRVLMYFSARRLPPREVPTPIKAQKMQIEEPEAHEDEDEADDETVAPSVSSAADIATVTKIDDEDLKGSVRGVPALLFDVGAGDVSILVRPTAETTSVSTDALKIDLDGVPVKRTVRALNDGIFLFEFSAGTTGGRLSVLLV
ncbi:hypothetical protein FIBSPDRAFT_513224 [Athelia psychrophila]|uniref:Uncharacterized protein n=1 Tax=Athelia psychrophila TaxID=1759441 RepID=A0A166V1C2_9AGAM|nr:hypothetical protein FIBSPDRAFT_513224 [Fibularhizoctonia sp. CBS 109695]